LDLAPACSTYFCKVMSLLEALIYIAELWTILCIFLFFFVFSCRCEVGDIMLEVERILRPKGVFLIKDTPELLELVASLGPSLHWQCHHHNGCTLRVPRQRQLMKAQRRPVQGAQART